VEGSQLRNLLAAALAVTVGLCSGWAARAAAALIVLVPTQTKIKYLVVIDDENVAFDHYFGTYPVAPNPPGEPRFTALPNTPSLNGIAGVIASQNLNLANPFRLDRSQDFTCDNTNLYMNEQQAFNGGLMDMFVQFTSPINPPPTCPPIPNLPMGYYDGNTVTEELRTVLRIERLLVRHHVRRDSRGTSESRLGRDARSYSFQYPG
jgi:phospholipase C